jgi:bifunctional DNase/RNase
VIEMELIGVRVELPANQPIVLLKETDGTRYLPIWIGAVEATAIAFALQGVETPRPLTHDLFVAVLGETGIELTAVHVTDLRDGTFYAELHLRQDGRTWTVSARPSDAIALAARLEDVPVLAAEPVLDDAGLEIDRTDEDGENGVNAEEEVRQFREFLDQVTPSDFEGGG